MKQLSPRQKAKKNGDRTYRTKSCKYGHNAERLTATGTCLECAVLAIRSKRKYKPFDAPIEHTGCKWGKRKKKVDMNTESETFDSMVKRIYKEENKW